MAVQTSLQTTSGLVSANSRFSFSDGIQMIMPNGDAPLYCITSEAGREVAIGTTHIFFTLQPVFTVLQVNDGSGLNTTDTTVVVDDSTGALPNQVYAVGAVDGEHIFVSSVDSSTQITVVRGFGTVAAASIADDTKLYLVGTAFEEASDRPSAYRIQEVDVSNKTQIFRNAWALSGTAAAVKRYVGGDVTSQDRMMCYKKHATEIETSLIFGQQKSATYNSKPIRTMDGIVGIAKTASQLTAMASTTNYTQLETALDSTFDYNSDPATGNVRDLYVGPKAFNVISAVLRNTSTGNNAININISDGATKFGLKYKTFRIGRGEYNLIQHPLLSTNALYSAMAICLERSSMKLAYIGGRDTEVEDYALTQAGVSRIVPDSGQDAVGGSVLSELTLECRNRYAIKVLTGFTAVGS